MSENFLNKEEEEIYKIVKEYLKKRPFFSIPEIVSYLNYYLRKNHDFNAIKIEIIIKILIKKNLIILGTKLVKENILEVPRRKEIYDFICNNPSTNINKIKNALEIGSNHVLWHLKFLEKFQFIRSAKLENQKIFFKFQLDEHYDQIFYYLRNDNVKKILKLIENSDDELTPTKIRDILKMHYYTIKKYLDILQNFNLITIGYNKNSYILNKKAYYEVLTELNKVLD